LQGLQSPMSKVLGDIPTAIQDI